jgi:hypothetical protein
MFQLVKFGHGIPLTVVRESREWQELRDFISSKATNSFRWGDSPWNDVQWEVYGTQYVIGFVPID